jgi:hypothetical protein
MERKREKTKTDGTGFGIEAEEAGTVAVVAACDGLMDAEVVRGEEFVSDVAAGRSLEDEFWVTPAADARLASGC